MESVQEILKKTHFWTTELKCGIQCTAPQKSAEIRSPTFALHSSTDHASCGSSLASHSQVADIGNHCPERCVHATHSAVARRGMFMLSGSSVSALWLLCRSLRCGRDESAAPATMSPSRCHEHKPTETKRNTESERENPMTSTIAATPSRRKEDWMGPGNDHSKKSDVKMHMPNQNHTLPTLKTRRSIRKWQGNLT